MYQGIWGSWFGGFRGCSVTVLSEISGCLSVRRTQLSLADLHSPQQCLYDNKSIVGEVLPIISNDISSGSWLIPEWHVWTDSYCRMERAMCMYMKHKKICIWRVIHTHLFWEYSLYWKLIVGIPGMRAFFFHSRFWFEQSPNTKYPQGQCRGEWARENGAWHE